MFSAQTSAKKVSMCVCFSVCLVREHLKTTVANRNTSHSSNLETTPNPNVDAEAYTVVVCELKI